MQPSDTAEQLSEALAKEITLLRLKKRLSKNQTATKAGLAVSFISDLESGKCKASLETLVKLAWVFGTSASAILSKCEQSVRYCPSRDA